MQGFCPSGNITECQIKHYFNINQANILPGFGVNPDTITMSGFSSGSFMTAQMSVILSERIKGAGMIAGGPYMVGEIFGVKGSAEEISQYSCANATQNAIDGLIDPTSNLKDKPVFVMSCELDKIINP